MSLSRENYRILLGIQIVLFSVWYSIGLSAPILDDGYGILNFITLYMLGGYIRLHGDTEKLLKHGKCMYLISYFLCSGLTFVLSYFVNPFGYCFITNIVGAAAIFVFTVKCRPRSNRYINRIAQSVFDVYFVHSDAGTSGLLISGLFMGRYLTDSPWMLLHLPVSIVLIFAIGMVANVIRRKWDMVTVDRLLNRWKRINLTHAI